MDSKFPAFYPITNVCIVADPQKCSPSYVLLMKSKDKEGDCDLWKETGMFKKTSRYLCFTRSFTKDNPDNMVLVAMQLLNEKDFPPTGFVIIDKTFDSEEKANKKRQLCVKMMSRDTTNEAINDIILLTKIKRPPEGEINAISICYKMGPVPPETQSFTHATATFVNNGSQPKISLRPAPTPPVSNPKPIPIPRNNQPASTNDVGKNEVHSLNVLNGIKFQLNPVISNIELASSKLTPSVSFRSINDIHNEFAYSFQLERSVVASSK